MPLSTNKTNFSERGKGEEKAREKLNPRDEVIELEKKLAEKRKELINSEKGAREMAQDIVSGEFKKAREAEPDIEKEKPEISALEEKEASFQKKPAISQAPQAQAPSKDEIDKIKTLDKDRQIKVLTDVAFEKGIIYAVNIAHNLNNAYILDEFHDQMVNQLYEKLVKKGKLKEI